MLFQKYIISLIFTFLSFTFLWGQAFGFHELVDTNAQLRMPFAIKNTPNNLSLLKENGVVLKNKTKEYLYFTATPDWISRQRATQKLSHFYFEYSPPELLDDTARAMQHVNKVHYGTNPLVDGYTGKGVIIGLVDSGLDYRHPDFVTANGKKRVIRYWDQTITQPTKSPQPYGYGQIWSKEELQNEECPVTNHNTGHGTTVTGICAGNGLADGRNKGMAPDAEIIFVETNFSLPNWTLTVADACDYIFSVADSLNKPAVINLSVGSYLGSHDARDPAAELMEQLVKEHSGRIIIGAAGNGGDKGSYHAGKSLSISDTNFIWFKNNSNSQLGDSTIFFDLWSDVDSAQFYYSFGANKPAPSYTDVAATAYRFAQINVGSVWHDTLRNSDGDRIATLEIYTEYMNGDYHMQCFVSKLDSVDYLFRFSITGKGRFDLWSGESWDLNKIIETLPSPTQYPKIVDYIRPDTLQTIVSSWNCSPDIVSVGNIRCRLGYKTHLGTMYYPSDMTASGHIAPSSSSGPTRTGYMKPDISATGDITLGAVPLYMVGDSTYFELLGELGWHGRNGGTSMASPVVAGIAALYLERCPKSTYADFISDLKLTAVNDVFTGTTPNYQYGYGKIDAFDLLTSKNQKYNIIGDTIICQSPAMLSSSIPLYDWHWSNSSTKKHAFVTQPDTINLWGRELSQGCKIYSDSIIVYQESLMANPSIFVQGGVLISSAEANYQWYKDGTPINGAINQSYSPGSSGFYSVGVQSINEFCKRFSNAVAWGFLKLKNEETPIIRVYPNPTTDVLFISTDKGVMDKILITAINGKVIYKRTVNSDKTQIPLRDLSKGSYFVKIVTEKGLNVVPFVKQ